MNLLGRAKLFCKLRFPTLFETLKSLTPAARQRQHQLAGRTAREVFTEIYETNAWQHPDSVSGYGSSMEATGEIRAALPPALTRIGARRLLDAPCGDFHWMQHVPLPCDYVGGDIVSDIVAKLQTTHSRPGREFTMLDVIHDPFPPADVFFCRDCLVHLSFADITRVLENFLRSGCSHAILSDYPSIRKNFDILTGEVRPLNLRLPPFNLPDPIEFLNDPGEKVLDRHMGVWSRSQIESACGASQRA